MEKQAPNQFSTLLECVKALEEQGYTDEFTLNEAELCHGSRSLDPAEFQVDSYHRFEGPTDPADMSVVYAVSSGSLGMKGLIIGAYGSETDDLVRKLMRHLDITHQPWLQGDTQPVEPIRAGASGKVL